MKTKKHYLYFAFVFVFILLSSTFLLACNKEHLAKENWSYNDTYHWHTCTACRNHKYDEEKHTFVANGVTKKCEVCNVEVAYTQQENAQFWIAGRDFTLVYSGNYTTKKSDIILRDDGSKTKNEYYETYGGDGKYVHWHYRYEVNKNGEENLTYKQFEVLKQMQVGEELKTVYHQEASGNEFPTNGTHYVAPNYIDDDDLSLKTSKQVEDYGIEEGLTYENILTNLKQEFIDAYGTEPSLIEFRREADGSITLNITISGNYEDTNSETGENFTSSFNDSFQIVVKNGRVIKTVDTFNESYIYQDSTKNRTNNQVRTTLLEYEFDKDTLDSISINLDDVITEE